MDPMEIDTPANSRPDNTNLNLEDRNEKKRNKTEHQELSRENMVTSGFIFITEFLRLLTRTKASKEDVSKYMQKVLHAIFFFGHINDRPISPLEFIPKPQQQIIQDKFPKPFKEYNTHPPSKTPYAILLEYMEKSHNTEDPDSFVGQLVEVNKSLWKLAEEKGNQPVANDFSFTASVITYSCYKDPQTNRDDKKAFGSSLSCRGKIPRRIMIAVSALFEWDKAISYAVLYGKTGPAIVFPADVHCKAYSFNTKERKYNCISPCTNCDRIFKNVVFNPKYHSSGKKETWPYGNCAETESLSKLLSCAPELREGTKTVPDVEGNMMYRNDIEKIFKDQHECKLRLDTMQLLRTRKISVQHESWDIFRPD
ncbi:uncharacterized protein O3C94_011384 [Discoglossus pictus]